MTGPARRASPIGLGWFNGITGGDIDHGRRHRLHREKCRLEHENITRQPIRRPCCITGEFDDSGRKRLIEAEFEEGVSYPVRGRSCSTNAMPFLGEKYASFREFALDSVADIYTPACLQEADRFEANTLETGVLINDGSARVRFSILSPAWRRCLPPSARP